MITDVRRDQIFQEMDGYLIKLDPTATGPRYFIDKIAICRNYLNNVSLVLSELQREKLVTTSELQKQQTIVEMESAKLLVTDEHVKRLANIKDRESMVTHILREKRHRIDELKDQILAIDGILKYVTLRSRELHATMDAIKNQRRFMHIEVQTGSFYGDERAPDVSVGMGASGTSGDFSEDQLRAMLEEPTPDVIKALGEAVQEPRLLPMKVEAPEEPQMKEVNLVVEAPPAPQVFTDDAEAIRQFLGDSPAPAGPSKSAQQAEIEDLSSLLDNV